MSHVAPLSSGPFIGSTDGLVRTLSGFTDSLVRVTTGLFLVPHGAQKLFGWFGGYGLEATGQFFATQLGLPASLALLTGLIEFFGGILLAVGLATRPAALLASGLLAVAAIKVHLGAGFFWTDGGFEYPVMWAILTLTFVIRGGGRYSLDRRLGL